MIIDRALEIYLSKRRLTTVTTEEEEEPVPKKFKISDVNSEQYGLDSCEWIISSEEESDSEMENITEVDSSSDENE